MPEQGIMTAESNADRKQSEKVEGEEGLRKVECLRGRLLAERSASRNAKEEADQLEKKLIELEVRLKEETKSRNRAERRLKSLMKKLESLEIFYVSDESERSGFLEKSEISTVSSVASTSTKEAENHKPDKITPNLATHDISELPMLEIHTQDSSSFPHSDSRENSISQISVSSSERSLTPSDEKSKHTCQLETNTQNMETAEKYPESPKSKENSGCVTEENIAKSSTCASTPTQNHQESDTETEWRSSECSRIMKDDEISKRDDQEEVERDDYSDVDNSLAIVAVEDMPKKEQRIDPVVLNATVKEALDALRHAKEKLQTSMERRRMIRVG